MSQVWAVTMVANEIDVVAQCLRHMVTEGVHGIVVADNLSNDGTRDKLDEFARQAPIPVVVLEDKEPGYYQGRKMTVLAHEASVRGAEWIIPFDIDELWYGEKQPLASEVLTAGPEVQVIGVPSYTYHPTGYDDLDEANLFRRMRYRLKWASSYPKVMYRYSPLTEIGMGNDAVYQMGKALPMVQWKETTGIAHFPIRTLEQFISKMRRGSQAYAAAKSLNQSFGAHWRSYGKILEKYGPDVMKVIFFSQFFVAEPWRLGLMEAPAPWCKW